MDRIDWRWTAAPLRFFSLHASIVLFFPLLIVTPGCPAIPSSRWRSMGPTSPIAGVREWGRFNGCGGLHLKYVVRGQWPAF